jgi:hypothetical protein
MEVLDPRDVETETRGKKVNGLTVYPRAMPLKILRIFRTRFAGLEEARHELKRVRIMQDYLEPSYMARPEEFLVDYACDGNPDFLLCGLQEFVEGEIFEPWHHVSEDLLRSLFRNMVQPAGDSGKGSDAWVESVIRNVEGFVRQARRMIAEAHHVPDLAGVGNLILTRTGELKLVDINNISRVSFDSKIPLDDRGYPVCDKSIRVLSRLEQELLGRLTEKNDPIYRTFLDPKRIDQVKVLEEQFHLSGLSTSSFYMPA